MRPFTADRIRCCSQGSVRSLHRNVPKRNCICSNSDLNAGVGHFSGVFWPNHFPRCARREDLAYPTARLGWRRLDSFSDSQWQELVAQFELGRTGCAFRASELLSRWQKSHDIGLQWLVASGWSAIRKLSRNRVRGSIGTNPRGTWTIDALSETGRLPRSRQN
jgi:hypothetical protein